MEPRNEMIHSAKKSREGDEFHSRRFVSLEETGFSRWGNHDVPQGLKPFPQARHCGTTGSRSLPNFDRRSLLLHA